MKTIRHRTDPDLVSLAALSLTAAVLTLVTAGVIQLVAAVAALAQCHMLWFLHLAAADGVVVVGYTDAPQGRMRVEAAGHGQFTDVVLRPCVTLGRPDRGDGRPVTDEELAVLHARSREHCFIARSVNFPVRHLPAPLRVDRSAGDVVAP